MAKSQKRSSREPKKPKSAGKKLVAPPPRLDILQPVPKKKGGSVVP